MIPKSIIDLTLDILWNDYYELKKIKNLTDARRKMSYHDPHYIKSVERNMEVYRLLITEYEKYLEENYNKIEVL